jgi:hypothetical protein
MTFARASALVVAFIAAVALGIWIGPYVTNRVDSMSDRPKAEVSEPTSAEAPKQARAPRRERVERRTEAASPASSVAVDLSSPELHKRIKPVLNRGTNLSLASEGFRDAEQFVTGLDGSRWREHAKAALAAFAVAGLVGWLSDEFVLKPFRASGFITTAIG